MRRRGGDGEFSPRLVHRRAEPHRCAIADQRARGADHAAVAGLERHLKTAAANAEALDGFGQRIGIGIGEPGGEIQHRLGTAAGGEEGAGLAEEARAIGVVGPQHDDFAGAGEEALVLIDEGAEAGDLFGGLELRGFGVAKLAAHQRRGKQRAPGGAERHGQRRCACRHVDGDALRQGR